jgi:hypothetical protein
LERCGSAQSRSTDYAEKNREFIGCINRKIISTPLTIAAPFWVITNGFQFISRSSEIRAAWPFRYEMDLMWGLNLVPYLVDVR